MDLTNLASTHFCEFDQLQLLNDGEDGGDYGDDDNDGGDAESEDGAGDDVG